MAPILITGAATILFDRSVLNPGSAVEPANPRRAVWNPGGAQASDTEVSKEFCTSASVFDTLN
jgi:hypothetical protein